MVSYGYVLDDPFHQSARPRGSELEAETREEACDCDLLSRAIPVMHSPA